jgi:hypothetical protein
MAEKRMFAVSVIDSDTFLDLPATAQSLYFHLAMRADDDGFVDSPKKIKRLLNASDDDLKLLIAKAFVIPFDSGVLVIRHWRIHNTIRKDCYKETFYKAEKELLEGGNGEAYELRNDYVTDSSRNRYGLGTDSARLCDEAVAQIRIDKIREDKIRLDKSSYGASDEADALEEIEKTSSVQKKSKRFKPPTVEEVRAYCEERRNGINAEAFIDYYATRGWKLGKDTMKDWKACIRTWERRQGYKPPKETASVPAQASQSDRSYKLDTWYDQAEAFDKMLEEQYGGGE